MEKNENRLNATMSIDTKRSRIRIHKAMLHQLGDPQYIQLLVDPHGMAVAVRCVDTPLFSDAVHAVSRERLCSDFSYEIYSRFFVAKLSSLTPAMGEGHLYHMRGRIMPAQRMAVFDLSTLKTAGS